MTGAAPGGVSVELAIPDDWHVHLRDDDLLATVAPITARSFRYALVMPNLMPPVTSTAAAIAYRDRIVTAAGAAARPDFHPIMSVYLNDQLDLDDFRRGVEQGVVHAAKYYPAGATTNSEAGGTGLADYTTVLEWMAETGVPLLVHAESTDPAIDVFDRERHFLDVELVPLAAALPELTITVEHLSTRSGIDFVAGHDQVWGSITPHHLSCDRSDLLANGLRPDLYCKPIINSAEDREALVAAATSGSERFFLGTDSAPHPASHKYDESAKPGIFNAPYALPVVAEVFHQAGALDQLERFTSLNGCRRYGFEPATETIRLDRALTDAASEPPEGAAPEVPDRLVTDGGQAVRIFGVAEARLWTVTSGVEAAAST